mgnify:CR=1 FL=1|tara:strand:- start:3438 stop:4970 length:1533 start_codon:yes stop_codon:yes gene_type:complete
MTLNARQIAFRERDNRNTTGSIQFLSAPVGSGKTEAIIWDIRAGIHNNSYIFISPTVRLAQEIKNRLDIALVNQGQGQNAHLIVTDETEPQSVQQRVLNRIISRLPNEQHILIITTETFRNVLPNIPQERKAHYHVFMDEGIEPVDFVEFRTQNQALFLEPIEIGDDHSFSIAEDGHELLEAVARSPARLAAMERQELSVPQYQQIAKFLTANIYDVYGDVSARTIRVVAFLRPDYFLSFRSVTIIMAIFEQSLLALFWQEKYGIEFSAYQTDHELFDTHGIKGPLISIHHALHPDDTASALNLKRNAETGAHGGDPENQERVIDRIAEAVEQRFGDRPYCWAANSFFANAPRILANPRMPTQCAGMDVFKQHDIVVSLTCINPPPWVKDIITRHVAITDGELYELWKLSHTYQTIGRCSLRDRRANRPIDVVVISRDCAERIQGLFEGSNIVGQITTLPSYEGMRHRRGAAIGRRTYTRADNTAWSRYRSSHPDTRLTKEEWYVTVRTN